jgi:hypothetical protein
MKVIFVTDKSKTWGDKVINYELDDSLLEPFLHFAWQLQCKSDITYVEMSENEWFTDEDGGRRWRVKPVCGWHIPEYEPTMTADEWHAKFERPPWYIERQWLTMGKRISMK